MHLDPNPSEIAREAPVDPSYVFGRFHPDRATWRGYWNEARVLAASLTKPATRCHEKFLIISRARSGTTLLTDLLGKHPEITSEKEVLAKAVLSPRRYLERLARKAPTAVYGAKFLSYQMVLTQVLADPRAFLVGLKDTGWTLLHLKRDSFSQTLSLVRAQNSRLYHSTSSTGGKAMLIDPDEFVRRLRWNVRLAEYEVACLEGLSPILLSYERDLTTPEDQAATARRIFSALGLDEIDVSSGLRKVSPSDPRESLANYDMIADAIQAAGLGSFLPKPV